MKKQWFIFKKKTETRWTAFESDKSLKHLRNRLRSGYEMKGPYKNMVESLMAANV